MYLGTVLKVGFQRGILNVATIATLSVGAIRLSLDWLSR
jgi:hypothetical protein